MIMERTNNQIKPSVSSTTLVTPDPKGSDSKSGATSGKTSQPRMPIGTAASAQIPRIFAREYCSVRLSSPAHLVVFAADIWVAPFFWFLVPCRDHPEQVVRILARWSAPSYGCARRSPATQLLVLLFLDQPFVLVSTVHLETHQHHQDHYKSSPKVRILGDLSAAGRPC